MICNCHSSYSNYNDPNKLIIITYNGYFKPCCVEHYYNISLNGPINMGQTASRNGLVTYDKLIMLYHKEKLIFVCKRKDYPNTNSFLQGITTIIIEIINITEDIINLEDKIKNDKEDYNELKSLYDSERILNKSYVKENSIIKSKYEKLKPEKESIDINVFTKKIVGKQIVYKDIEEYVYDYSYMKSSREELHREFKYLYRIFQRMIQNRYIPEAILVVSSK